MRAVAPFVALLAGVLWGSPVAAVVPVPELAGHVTDLTGTLPPDRVAGAMQGVADAFTASIGSRPEDWHMLGRIWADVPPRDPAPPGRA